MGVGEFKCTGGQWVIMAPKSTKSVFPLYSRCGHFSAVISIEKRSVGKSVMTPSCVSGCRKAFQSGSLSFRVLQVFLSSSEMFPVITLYCHVKEMRHTVSFFVVSCLKFIHALILLRCIQNSFRVRTVK